MLVNGNIAIEAVAAFGRGVAAAGVVTAGVAPGCHFKMRIGRSMS